MRSSGYGVCAIISLSSLILSLVAVNGVDYITSATPAHLPLFETRYGLFRRCDRAAGETEWRCRRFPKRQLDCPAYSSSDVSLASTSSRPRLSSAAKLHFSTLMGVRRSDDTLLAEEDVRTAGLDWFSDEDRDHWGFCHLYVTAGYAAQLSVALAACATFAFILVVLPPISSRERKAHGWKLAAGLAGLHAALQIASTAILAHLLRTSGRFAPDTALGPSWAIATSSWAIGVLLVGGLVFAEVYGIARQVDDLGYTAIPDGE